MSDDWIDETGNSNAIKQIADESGASNHCARRYGRAGIGKSELKQPERQERNARGFIGRRHALQEEPVISNEAVAVAEHEGKTEGVKENAAKACVYNAFH